MKCYLFNTAVGDDSFHYGNLFRVCDLLYSVLYYMMASSVEEILLFIHFYSFPHFLCHLSIPPSPPSLVASQVFASFRVRVADTEIFSNPNSVFLSSISPFLNFSNSSNPISFDQS